MNLAEVIHGARGHHIITGDVFAGLHALPDECVQCVVTSPPYWGLRDYGAEGQIGSEPTVAEYVETMRRVFAEVRRVLRPDGTLWLNLGDTYAGSWGARGRGEKTNAPRPDLEAKHGTACPARNGDRALGVKPKDLIGVPWRVAFALQADGWYLRSDIIWHKPNPMPSSVRDRPTTAHEYLFLLSKSPRYFYDAEAVKETAITAGRGPRVFGSKSQRGTKRQDIGNIFTDQGARNRRSVWTIPTHSYRGAHFATFPPRLVEPCILAGTPEGGCCGLCERPYVRQVERSRVATRPGLDNVLDPTGKANRDPGRHVTETKTVGWEPGCSCYPRRNPVPALVLDPFAGSGTTLMVAVRHGRRAVGVELNAEYVRLAEKRIGEGK